MSQKIERIAQDMHRVLYEILKELKDPRIGGMLSIVRVDVTADLSYATVYVSAVEGLEQAQSAVKGLKAAVGFIRRELAHRMKLRHTPELRFVADGSIEHGADIARMLKEIQEEE